MDTTTPSTAPAEGQPVPAPAAPLVPAEPAPPAPPAPPPAPAPAAAVVPVTTQAPVRRMAIPQRAGAATAPTARAINEAIERALGMPIDEARARLSGQPPAPAVAAPTPETEAALAAARAEAAAATERAETAERKAKRARLRAEVRTTEMQLRIIALTAGIAERHVGFAINELSNALAGVAPGKEPDPKAFFEGLRADQPFLFVAAPAVAAPAAPVAPAPILLAPTTTPPASAQPGGAPPPAVRPGAPAPTPNVEDMSTADFNEYRRKKYGMHRSR